MVRFFLFMVVWSLRAALRSRGSVALENLALRQQLAAYARTQKRPQLKPEERSFWVALSRLWTGWRSALVVVKPATVISWHRRASRAYWRWRSRRPVRPRIPDDHIALIRRISAQNPQRGDDRIAEELAVKLGVRRSASTIRRYMVRRSTPRGRQRWKTFIKNHAHQVFAVDFLTHTTAFFAVVYIFVVMEVGSRRIVAINATTSPGLEWVKQQSRQVTAWGQTPRFLVHDNDGIFGQYRDGRRRGEKGRRYRCQLDLWLAEVMGIPGLPVPYFAPNASPYIVADGVGRNESEFGQKVGVVAVAATPPHQGLPAVVQGLDASAGGMVLAQGDDLRKMRFEGFVQLAHRHIVSTLGTTQDAPQPVVQASTVGSTKYGAPLFDQLVGTSKLTIESEQLAQPQALLLALTLPGTQHQPAAALAGCAQVGPGTKEDRSAQLGDGFPSAFDDVEGVVDDGRVGQSGVVANGLLERFVHVAREQLDPRLLLGCERVEPRLERLVPAAVAHPHHGGGSLGRKTA